MERPEVTTTVPDMHQQQTSYLILINETVVLGAALFLILPNCRYQALKLGCESRLGRVPDRQHLLASS